MEAERLLAVGAVRSCDHDDLGDERGGGCADDGPAADEVDVGAAAGERVGGRVAAAVDAPAGAGPASR